ncbi:MAG: hypothetical protein ACOY93_18985 [Bacillota bacterium]
MPGLQSLPSAQPQFQAAQPPFQPGFQTQVQQQPVMQQQAAPVAPVACPAYTPPFGAQAAGQPQQAAPTPAQMLARQMVDLARTLEQLIPGYQIMQSILVELQATGAAQPVAGFREAVEGLKDAVYYHGATLGTIRRILCGEMSPNVLTNLAVAFLSLGQVQTRIRPLLERLTMAAPTTVRGSIASLTQTVTASDLLLGQAGSAIQGIVGPQVWDAARSRVQEFGELRAAQPAAAET